MPEPRMPETPRETWRLQRLAIRAACAIAAGVAAAIGVLAFCPGATRAAGAAYTVAGQPPWIAAVLALMIAPLLPIWRRPSLGLLVLWSVLSVIGTVFVVWLTMWRALAPESVVEVLWTTELYEALLLLLVALQALLIPLTCGALALISRRAEQRRRAPAPLAAARVHRLGR